MRTLAALATVTWLAAGSPATAGVFVLEPGPEGEDSSPYAFQPFLNRGQYPTVYVFDGGGGEASHTFETYLRFELPPNLLQPGETVTAAALRVTYAFDFVGYGDTTNVSGAVRTHRVDAAWSEANLTWVNRPLLGPALAEVTGIGFPPPPATFQLPVPLDFDVTLVVRDWALGIEPNYGFALVPASKRVIGMYSFEAEYGPVPPQIPPTLRAKLAISTGPGGPVDADGDGHVDAVDNCRYEPNNNQLDNGGVGTFTGNGIGNACECGDTSDDGSVQTLTDVDPLRNALAGLPATIPAQQKCSTRGAINAVDGPDPDLLRDDCQLDDIVVIRRALAGKAPGIGQICDPATP